MKDAKKRITLALGIVVSVFIGTVLIRAGDANSHSSGEEKRVKVKSTKKKISFTNDILPLFTKKGKDWQPGDNALRQVSFFQSYYRK